MTNHVEIYVPKRPRRYEKHLLNLLKSSIPDIFTSMLMIFSVQTLVSNYVMASTQNWTADFPVSNNRMNIFILYALSCLFPRTFFIGTIAFTPPKKASALRKFKMAVKQPTSVSFHFEKKNRQLIRKHQEKTPMYVCP